MKQSDWISVKDRLPSMADVYNSIIEVIERHIKENRFNKKYLK